MKTKVGPAAIAVAVVVVLGIAYMMFKNAAPNNVNSGQPPTPPPGYISGQGNAGNGSKGK